ncbi:hypothetical protein EB796_007959 [Bugula neritina]|uniref:Uncharacterized protein n=1 Tax=Bugula neritina TaxID=10212 RepID=A0A7J7K530_BUGNE|nr:hypothetical protein EB796_007959 [Bugula neritina]
MYTTRSQQLYDYTLPLHNPFIPPQHRAPAVNPAFSPPEYSPQYEQPIPYHKTSAESLDKEELATSEIKASADTIHHQMSCMSTQTMLETSANQ